ncbi:MAG: formate dehydrogenase accessory sulfurtransferase FdhD [Haliangiales bacterium]
MLVAEAPLELRADGRQLLVTMRTPGHDRELARGLLFAEGFLAATHPFDDVREPDDLSGDERGNVLDIGGLADADLPARGFPATAACGVCGKQSIADLALRAEPIRAALSVPAALVAELPERLRAAQAVFEQTGGLHAAGLFDADGQLLAVREDIGRHNAVDKLIGWALAADQLPLTRSILCVSSRIGFEIVQKAIVAGVPIVVAVSAPSALAVDLAERFRVTLCGFARGRRFNIYSHASRVGVG